MNEQIRELVTQANAWFPIGYPSCGGEDDGWQNIVAFKEKDLKKFVELIAIECANVAAQTPCPYEDESARQNYGHAWDMACVEAGRNIRKYFEVEK